MPTTEFDPQLEPVLERARTAGFLGPGPLRVHAASCAAFGRALDVNDCGSIVDLGAGGGLPSLPLLVDRPTVRAVLVDTSMKRAAFLRWAAAELQIDDRVDVRCARAEELAHDPAVREVFDLAVARGFASASVTLECAAPMVRDGGAIVLAGPPGGRRWVTENLAGLGLRPAPEFTAEAGADAATVQVLRREGAVDASLPRPWRQLMKRPLEVEIAS